MENDTGDCEGDGKLRDEPVEDGRVAAAVLVDGGAHLIAR